MFTMKEDIKGIDNAKDNKNPDKVVDTAEGNSLAVWLIPLAVALLLSLTKFIIKACCEGKAKTLNVVNKT